MYSENIFKNQFSRFTKIFQKELNANQIRFSTEQTLGDYNYYTTLDKSSQYEIYLRRKNDGEEQLILDQSEEFKKYKQYKVVGIKLSNSQTKLMHLGVRYPTKLLEVWINNIEGGKCETLPLEVTGVRNAEWFDDNSFFYTLANSNMLATRIYYHVIGTKSSEDILVYENNDVSYMEISRTKDWKYLLISTLSSVVETRLIDFKNHLAHPKLIMTQNILSEAYIDHVGDNFYVVKKESGQKSYSFFKIDDNKLEPENWQLLKTSEPDIFYQFVDMFETKIITHEKYDGENHLKIFDLNTRETKNIELPQKICQISTKSNLVRFL